MKHYLAGAAAAAAMAVASNAGAAAVTAPPYLQVLPAPSITAPAAGAAECQEAVSKNTQKFVKSMLKTRSKCLSDSISSNDYALCPNADDDAKVVKAALKSRDKIVDACATTTGLGNSYSGESGDDVASCTLGQTHGEMEIYIAETHGGPAGPVATACQLAIDKASNKLLPTLLKTSNKCIQYKLDHAETADLGAKCVGSMSNLVITQPTDLKTNDKFNKTILKAWDTMKGACENLSTTEVAGLYGCPGATTYNHLQQCVEAQAITSLIDIVNSEYSETGTIIQPGAGAIQAAVNAASSGDKILVASGTYQEGVTLPAGTCSVSLGSCPADNKCSAVSTHPGDACSSNVDCLGTCTAGSNNGAPCTVDGDCTGGGNCQVGTCEAACTGGGGDVCQSAADNLQIVGCGAAYDQRPRVIPPAVSPPNRGFQAIGVDGLHFEGLEVTGWANDGLFVSGANGVSFRDILGDGDDQSTPSVVDAVSTYAIFPVKSTNVVVEGCHVINVRDAGIYVGQSNGIVMRDNYVTDCVSGMEVENSLNSIVYGNVMTNNTGGLLVFKLQGPEHQVSGGHHVFDNISYENNVNNFAIPGTTVAAVPTGTGYMVISEDDSVFENNFAARNRSYGILILDQQAINILTGASDPLSYDQDVSNLTFLNNYLPQTAKKNGYSASRRCSGGADDGEFCEGNTQCDSNNCMATPFGNNWVFAINTSPNGTCWTPVPHPDFSTATLAVSSFPACP